MEPLSITASILGVAVPALKSVKWLRHSIATIRDAPVEIASLGEELSVIEQAITSIQEVSDQEWQSLSESVVTQSKTGISLCQESCRKFQSAINHWTRHSDDGMLSWRDRTTLSLFRQEQIKSTFSQLQNCKSTLTSVVSIATFRHSLEQTSTNTKFWELVSSNETEIRKKILATERQLSEVNARLEKLHLGRLGEVEIDPDQAAATDQVENENSAIKQSLELLSTLLENIQSAAKEVTKDREQTIHTVTFGSYNKGIQTGINNGPINFSIGGTDEDKGVDK
ncbi:ATP-NAD kinase [Fusarium beomiforme]|uniref:ATP-NAD kinase n=1 Tax=Fusarium beomiforme TaxID=44412 RepID=A0A9P5A559_9HYPO|nr:ATP-NAD kinase [Fusarium beomiforme]